MTASDTEHRRDSRRLACIHDLLAAQVDKSREATAIAAPGRKALSYGHLLGHVGEVVKSLNAMGIGRNDRVALVLPNGPEMAVAFLGVAAAATCAPLNPAYRAQEFEFYLSDLRARALIVLAGTESPVRKVARSRSIPVIELLPGPETEAGMFKLKAEAGAACALPGLAKPDDVALVLHTSGTTSRPKIVPLTHANICVSAQNIRASLELTATDCCLNVMPLFHIHGLIAAVLASLASGGSVVCTPGFDAERFFRWVRRFLPTWFTAVPTMHQAIVSHAADEGEHLDCSSLRFIRSCSSALPPPVMAQLEERFAVPVVEAYGMTEASHQIASNPLPPRARKPGFVGIAAGPEIAVMDDAGNMLSSGEKGEIVIHGPNVMHGYEGNPVANQSAFTNAWFRTGDQGFLDSDGYLYITGRIKEIINRGGEKVSPREVDEVLMDHPAVAQAVTFALPHPSLGEDVVAAVVLRKGAFSTDIELRDFAATRLAAHKLPRQVLIVSEIPKGPTGKLQRRGLGEQLASMLRVEYVASRNPVEELLTSIWADLLEVERVGVNDNFFMAGGSSLLAVEMLVRVQAAFGVDLQLDSIFGWPTVADLATMIQEGKGKETAPPGEAGWQMDEPAVVPVQPHGSRPPFFMVGLGLGWEVRDLSRHLGPDQPVYGLRPSALLHSRKTKMSAQALAAYYIDAIREVRPHGPYALGGACAAGIVAFEMAQQLRAKGEKVPLLVLFDVDYPPAGFLPGLLGVWLLRLPREWARFVKLTNRERWAYLRQMANVWQARIRARLIPRRMLREGRLNDVKYPAQAGKHIEQLLAPLRDAVWRYTPLPYPGRIALFLAADTGVWFHRDRRLDWRSVATGRCEVHVIPGQHNHALEEPHVRIAAEKLRACIDDARKTHPDEGT